MQKRERGKGRGKREGLRVKVGKRERGKRGGLRWEERGMAEGRVKAGRGLNVKGGEKGEG